MFTSSPTVTVRRRAWIFVLLAALWLAVPTLARADATPQADLALLNQERAAWGLPAGVTENPEWSSDCAAHDNYERQNGGQLTHDETPGNPGYTQGGAFAGQNSILAQGGTWTAGNNPWENGPIHLIQLFTPSLAQTGIDDAGGFQCAVTLPGQTRTPVTQETVYTYPGDGTTGFVTSENANESPFVPGDFVGLPNGTITGREIFVYLNEPGQTGQTKVNIQSATLTAPSGPLAVKWVDQTTGTIGPYLTGGIIIPVNPLPEGTQIQASVALNGPNGVVTHNWSFTTAQSPSATVSVDATGMNITFTTKSPAPALLRVFTPPDSGSYFILDDPVNPGTGPIPDIGNLPTGQQLVACVAQNATNGFDAQTACSTPFTIPTPGGGGLGGAITYLHLKAQLNGPHLSVTLPGLALGHTVSVTMAYTGRACRSGKCRTVSRGTRQLKRKATGTALSVLVPTVAGATRVKLTVTVLPFIKGGKTYQGKPVVVAGKV